MGILEVRGLVKRYPRFELGPIDFALEPGKITGFIGRNGACKTTTLKSLLGLFNLVFFGVYYRDVRKVGKAFALSSLVVFLYISLVEAACHVLPLFRDRLDRPDPEEAGIKLLVLGLGAAAFAGLTFLAYLRGRRDFERQDL